MPRLPLRRGRVNARPLRSVDISIAGSPRRRNSKSEDCGLSQLPVIVGLGGVNAAGRTSGHQAFRRTVFNALPTEQQDDTLLGLASLMALAHRDEQGQWFDHEGTPCSAQTIVTRYRDDIMNHTLIRRIAPPAPGAEGITANSRAHLALSAPITFTLKQRELPELIPDHWQVTELEGRRVEVTVPAGPMEVLLPDVRQTLVHSSAQLPRGFDPSAFYRSVHHPRALTMTIFGASDCLGQSGLEWETIVNHVAPDEIGVYASNSTGQLDQQGWGGLLQSYVTGNRATSKQMPLGYGQMPADFLNAYVLGSVGATGAMQGACATFLYNLRLAVDDIMAGRRRVVMVGTCDTPLTPEVVEGFRAMSALADDSSLKALDALELLTDEDYQRACRPFARNCGFTIGEAAQFILLMDDRLAMELGAEIYASVPGVFVNADGWKKSISAPGIGNYLTLARSVSLVRDILGDDAIRTRSYVHAHGTSTPKNRETESHVLHQVAKAFNIESWPIAAIKAYIGHSQGSAAGDQIASAIGSFAHGIVPGIETLDAVADDVHSDYLLFSQQHLTRDMDVAFINAKGFGGNNATAPLLSPAVTEKLLRQRHGDDAVDDWKTRREHTRTHVAQFNERSQNGIFEPQYHFGHNVLEGPELTITDTEVQIPGYARPISLKVHNPFGCVK